MNRLRRGVLEMWLLLPMGMVVGFLGPFGTYTQGDFISRVQHWLMLLLGAYVVVRPTLFFWAWIARQTRLPRGTVMIWGITMSSAPMALLWRSAGRAELRLLDGYVGILPFAFLSALSILVVAGWADHLDAFLLRTYHGPGLSRDGAEPTALLPEAVAANAGLAGAGAASIAMPHVPRIGGKPRLADRVGPSFGGGDILALESEDHYVRVHGTRGNELLLLRLRDAIAEMDDVPGEQTHRSWWIANHAVAGITRAGRNMEIILTNGERAPVARDSIDRLERSGFLPTRAVGEG